MPNSLCGPSFWASRGKSHSDTLVLFDVDGTLTVPRQKVSDEMYKLVSQLSKLCVIGFVGGSDLVKQQEQLGDDVLDLFDFAFSENGLSAYRLGVLLESQSFIKWFGYEEYKKFVNFSLRYIADLDLPVKSGTFIELRNGMVNISPIGRNCSQRERVDFEEYDKKQGIRSKMVDALSKQFPHINLKYSIGGQISFDVFPIGWDKTYSLRHIEKEGFKKIYFFGDKTELGGNDYEIFRDSRIVGKSVACPEDTAAHIKKLFNL